MIELEGHPEAISSNESGDWPQLHESGPAGGQAGGVALEDLISGTLPEADKQKGMAVQIV